MPPPDRESRPGVNRAAGVSTASETGVIVRPPRRIRWYSDTDDACCPDRLIGLRFPGNRIRCGEHAEPGDVRLVAELDERAAAVGVKPRRLGWWGQALAWPCPNADVEMRGRMLAWAEAEGLTYVDRPHRCLNWLRAGGCRSFRCRTAPESAWLDHVSCWARKGRPAVLVAQPYELGPEDVDDLGALNDEAGLRVEVRRESWYGRTWLVMVRSVVA